MTTYIDYRIRGLKTFPLGDSVRILGEGIIFKFIIIFLKAFFFFFEVDLALQTADLLLFSSFQGPCSNYFLLSRLAQVMCECAEPVCCGVWKA